MPNTVSNLIKLLFRRGGKQQHPLIINNNRTFPPGEVFTGAMSEYEFVVFDTELTGFSRKYDEIVAIGAVRIKHMQIVCGETFYALVRPEGKKQSKSTLVHRLTPQDLMKAERMADVLPRFLEFCGTAFLVGHFVRLDLEFINRAAKRHLGGILTTPYLDTMGLAMAYNDMENGVTSDHSNRQGAYSLGTLSKAYGLLPFEEHNALQDALQTAFLFLYLVKKMHHYGKRTMAEYLDAGRGKTSHWWHF